MAMLVLFGHSWPIVNGAQDDGPLSAFMYRGVHEFALFMFFFVSGLLITESARRRQNDMVGFVSARVKRIMPGLIVCALAFPATLALLGAWPTLSPDSYTDYVAQLVTLISIEFFVEGAFEGHSDRKRCERIGVVHSP